MTPLLLKLMQEHDQDTAALREWWDAHDDDVKGRLWHRIQMPGIDPEAEVVLRLAQWAFTEWSLKVEEEEQP